MQWKQRKQNLGIVLALHIILVFFPWQIAHAASTFINEIHYDNIGGDTGEGVEIAGPAGTDLSGWSIVLYNGSGGASYDTISLSGTIDNQHNGFGTLSFFEAPIQNGSPDGLALVDAGNTIVQFLSYEGTLTALAGPANGLTSTDIGVVESNSTTHIGYSLQLSGTGKISSDFTWMAPGASTFGNVNSGQVFQASTHQPVPEPSTILLLGSGIVMLGIWRQKRVRKIAGS